MRRPKIRVLHYGAPPIVYGSPSFYKFISYLLLGENINIIPHYYPEIFDVEYFTWTKRAFHRINGKKVYLLDFSNSS